MVLTFVGGKNILGARTPCAALPSLFYVVTIARQIAWAIFLGVRGRGQESPSPRSTTQFVGLFPYLPRKMNDQHIVFVTAPVYE